MSQITKTRIEQFQELGYFVTGVVFDPHELDELAQDMERVYEEDLVELERNGTPEQVEMHKNQRSYDHFHERSPVARRFVKKPFYCEASRTFIGDEVDLYWNQAMSKPPARGRTFGWHQDSGYAVTEPLHYITCWTAVSDSTIDNGCVWIIPGSHRWGLLPHVRQPSTADTYPGLTAQFSDESGAIPVPLRAGQVAIFSSLMLHKSGPNTSRSIRRGFIPQYHVPNPLRIDNGEVFGDCFPILRNGKPVES
ncbi:MAG TPA: phytanoyl-CoA dioxygenase family protein [Polyangiaceae bacterium]